LEDRVKERTLALTATTERLQKEIATRAQAETNVRKSEASLRELSVELLRAQDDERRHLARELHDGLGQSLAGLKLSLHFLEESVLVAKESVRKHYAECLDITEDAITLVRTLSHLMYPPLLEQMGLESAIPWYVRGFEQRSGINTMLEMPVHLQRLPREMELTIFRILQESLTNIHRHSGSRNALVALKVTNESIILQVQDSGKGIRQKPPGVGLRSMQERAKQLAGKLEILSGAEGTTITAILPFKEHSASIGAS
jgi:two-component system, NarL family, sensor kinase